jgi:Flp pilus assembly protein TadG
MREPRATLSAGIRPARPGAGRAACARRLATGLSALRGDTRGSMALEYALVGPAFIVLILGILHIALIYFAQEGLETAVESAARLIMTGQAQTIVLPSGKTTYTGMTASDFKTAVCSSVTGKDVNGNAVTYASSLPPFLACDRLAVNVQVVPSNCASPTITTPTYTYTNGTLTSTGTGFGAVTCAGAWSNASTATNTTAQGQLAGTQGKLVIMQLSYLWPTVSLPWGLTFANQQGNNRLLLATYVFTVESYLCSDGTTTSC